MYQNRRFHCLFLLAGLFLYAPARTQTTWIVDSSESCCRTVIAGKEYEAGGLKRFLWGTDYRQEWTTPVKVPLLSIDTAFGGMRPLELGGGRQTKSLHLEDAAGRRWVLRTVNKRYTLALPPILRGSFLEDIANDQIATNHPYAALTIPSMADAAGVYHANPRLVVVAPSPGLGAFSDIFAYALCLLEERPDETHIQTPSFGFPKDIDGSDKMVENITGDNDFQMDQHWYVKTRLFDMLVGDWGRHIDNWRWAQFDTAGIDLYRPVPKDRDQTQAKFQGVLFRLVKSIAGMKQLQTFDDRIRDINRFNFPALEIDRRFTNGLPKQVWIDSAMALQQYLTDEVIEAGVRKMPPEIFAISGEETIRKLKARRNDLPQYAAAYYDFLSKKVDVPGSKKKELFHVVRESDSTTLLRVHKINKEGEVIGEPFFSRSFRHDETSEIRLYGLGGNDVYKLEGDVNDGITVRVIAGSGEDSLLDMSHVHGGTNRTKYYDNKNSGISASAETKIRLDDTLYIYPFNEKFKYDVKGFSIKPGLNTFYRVFVGIAYKKRTHGWREKPFESEWRVGLNYSVIEKSFHPYVQWLRPHLFSAWNLGVEFGFDEARRFNYFGTGNETPYVQDKRYYQFRTKNFYFSTAIDRDLGRRHNLELGLGYDGIQVWNHEGRLVSKPTGVVGLSTFDWKHFGSAAATYRFLSVNDLIMPTKGINFIARASYNMNLEETGRTFARYSSGLVFYLPLFGDFTFTSKSGIETVEGEPEFYQLNHLGGNANLRGHLRFRFWGKTVFYNQKELRWVPEVRSRLMNGRAGLVALYDHGRVWHPGTESGKWHSGYGGGIIIVPFNKVFTMLTYSVSSDDQLFNIRLGKFF
ncbi:MAG TPA: hypothetical protein VFZ78_11965 [Flavisolibacter sp.]